MHSHHPEYKRLCKDEKFIKMLNDFLSYIGHDHAMQLTKCLLRVIIVVFLPLDSIRFVLFKFVECQYLQEMCIECKM
jgi:hypothetical protein